jgi:glycosyltransferase involved in cell wall biosynthesis
MFQHSCPVHAPEHVNWHGVSGAGQARLPQPLWGNGSGPGTGESQDCEEKGTVPMDHPARKSVCMAAYNGSLFIEEQIRSILPELEEGDEIVIVDDCSTDSTADVVKGIPDPRIRLLTNEHNMGYVKTFERALASGTGDYLFLSDQDDIWLPGRVKQMMEALQDKMMVVSNCSHFGGGAGRFHEIRLRSADSGRRAANIAGILVGYRLHWGCAMALRADLLQLALPFPGRMRESYDQFLAMAGNVAGSIVYLEEDTVLHRLHGNNLTPARIRGPLAILRARAVFAENLAILLLRLRRLRPAFGSR